MTQIQIQGTKFAADDPGYEAARLQGGSTSLLGSSSAAWAEASAIEWGPERYRTRFQARWDDQALHVRFDAVDAAPWHTMTRRDDHIWEEEAVEIFLDADGSGRNYAELEISPVNVVCDLRVVTAWPNVKSLTEWDWTGMASAVEPLKDTHGTVEGWTAVARLPWAALRSLYPSAAVALPPAPKAAWRFNVFRIKRPGGPSDPKTGVVYAAWSKPAGPSFHDPAAFRPIVWAGRG